jgi:hypothetical protein
MFDGVIEWDAEDKYDRRLKKFTSYRVGMTEDMLTSNYSSLGSQTVKNFLELERHKLVFAGDYVFISHKEREDWWIVDTAKGLFKVDDDWFAIWQDDTLLFYKDDVEIYDENFVYVTPTPEKTYENVKWVPKVVNVKDPLDQYQNHNLYFVEKIENADTIADFEYNLIRFYNDFTRDRTEFQTIRRGLGISYDPLSYNSRVAFPKITEYISLDYIWIDLYDEENDLDYAFDNEDTKLVYSYVMEYQSKQPDGLGGFVYPKDKLLVVARDGYNYDPNTNGFFYNVLEKLTDDTYDKYIFQERVVTSILEEELKRSVSSQQQDIETVFDVFVPSEGEISENNYFNFRGYWDVSTGNPPISNGSQKHGDYWLVSVQGEYNLTGINQTWGVDDVAVWNGNFEYWEKNNEIPNLTDEIQSRYKIDRTLVVLSKPEFDFVDENDNSMVTPYEKSGGMYLIKLSEIPLNIAAYTDIISVDTNAIETFGDNPFVLFSYTDKDDSRVRTIVVPMDRFTNKVFSADLTRILHKYPYENSNLTIYDVQFTDKHIIVYASDSKNTSLGTFAIIMENIGYNLPLGIRTNNMNVSYDTDLRDLTRKYQPFYRTEDADGEEIDDEEVAAFRATLQRYTPISAESENLAALVYMGYTDQKIEPESEPEQFTVTFPATGAQKDLKEQSNIKMQESLLLRVDGDPNDVNCDCSRQREILYVYDFEAMTIFYDIVNRVPDPNVYGVPSKVAVNKIDKTRDVYSRFQNVCRWESDWFEYYYDEGDTFPMRVRTKIRVNSYDQFQQFVPWGSNGILKYNWAIHFQVQYLQNDPETTIADWIDAILEETYKPIVEFDECNPVGQFYTTDLIDDGSTFPMVIVDDGSTIPNLVPAEPKDPWDVYDVPAAKISLT